MRLVRERQGRVPNAVEVRHRVLKRRDGSDERGSGRGLQLAVLEEPRQVVGQEERDLERDVRVDRLGLQALAGERPGCGTRRQLGLGLLLGTAEGRGEEFNDAEEGEVVEDGILWRIARGPERVLAVHDRQRHLGVELPRLLLCFLGTPAEGVVDLVF